MRNALITPRLVAVAIALTIATAASGDSRLTTIYNVTGSYLTALSQGSGVLYNIGADPGGGQCAAVLELRPPTSHGGEWTEELLYAFASTGGDACGPEGTPIPAPDGSLYGLAYQGGAYGNGALYQLLPPSSPGGSWTERVLCSVPFNETGQPQNPSTGLVSGPGGSFYFAVAVGGTYEGGQLMQFVPPATAGASWTVSQVYSFGQNQGGPVGPYGTLIAGPTGSLYGFSGGGVSKYPFGAVFEATPPRTPRGSWSATVLYNFGNGTGNGGNPSALMLADDGTLFGATYGRVLNEPVYGASVAFRLSPPAAGESNWSYRVLREFNGLHPDSNVILRDGSLYLATASPTGGEIFKLSPPAAPGPWDAALLYHFTNGQTPFDQLIMNPDGTIFGITGAMSVPSNLATGTVFMLRTK